MNVGFSFMYPPRDVSELVAATRHLLASDGWDKPLRYFTAIAAPGSDMVRRPGMLDKKRLLDVAGEALRSPATSVLTMTTSARNDDDFARLWVRGHARSWTGPHLHASGARPLGTAASHRAWLDAVIAFAGATASFQGVVFAAENDSDAHREGELLTGHAPGKDTHPMYPEWARMAADEKQVGTRYVRFPRWGTLYSHAHVAALGGAARIVEVVQPAVVRELPGGVYFQLTDSLDTAQSEEATRKRRAFTELAEPLLPPPLPA